MDNQEIKKEIDNLQETAGGIVFTVELDGKAMFEASLSMLLNYSNVLALIFEVPFAIVLPAIPSMGSICFKYEEFKEVSIKIRKLEAI